MSFLGHSPYLILLAGVALFMYGGSLASEHLQKLAANNLRDLMGRLNNNPMLAILLGIGLTILLQSSGAVTSLLVSLGSASVIHLPEVMGVIIGSAIGSTFTVQLISFDVAHYGLPLFTIAFSFYFLTHKPKLKSFLGVLMGFGLIFFGLQMMADGAKVIKTIPHIDELFVYFNQNPFIVLLATSALTGILHSSAVVIGLAMSLCAADVIDVQHSIYWVFGANIGTTSTALMASVGSNFIGRQVAWAHFFYKVGSVLIFYPFAILFIDLIAGLGGNEVHTIANAHTFFNIISAAIFYPFISIGVKWIENNFKPNKSELQFAPKYLKRSSIRTPSLAITEAIREIERMGDIVISMVRDSLLIFEKYDAEMIRTIHERDHKVDVLQAEIKKFLVELSGDQGLNESIVRMISLVSDLEGAADVIDHSLVKLAEKKNSLCVNFSAEGWQEISKLHHEVLDLGNLSMSCFMLQDKQMAQSIITHKREIRKMESALRNSHYERLNRGMKESLKTSSIHLEILSDYRRIVGLISNHLYDIAKEQKK